jgi:ethanolamine ammonia-lyase large subunit
MAFAHTIGSTRYAFADLRDLLAKATPLRSGDVLAGLAAELSGISARAASIKS